MALTSGKGQPQKLIQVRKVVAIKRPWKGRLRLRVGGKDIEESFLEDARSLEEQRELA